MAKWIRFDKMAPGTKTDLWAIRALDGSGDLGAVKWFGAWRKYCFFPCDGTLYEQDCLRDIATFCETATAEYRQRKRAENQAVGV